jgi:hypothetical protein
LRLVALGGGNEVLFHQQLLAFEVALELGQVGLGAHHFGLLHAERGACGFDVGLGLAQAVLEGFRVDAGDQLVQFLHRRVEVDQDFLDLARNLRADLHRDHRVQCAGGGNHGRQRSVRPLPVLNFGASPEPLARQAA